MEESKFNELMRGIEEKKSKPKREARKRRKEQSKKELFKEYGELFSWDVNSKRLTCLKNDNHRKVIEAISFCRGNIEKFTSDIKKEEFEKIKIIINFDLKIPKKTTFEGKIDLSKCIFQKNFEIIDSIFNGQVLISDSVFKGDINLGETTFKKSVKFHRSVFEEGIKLMNTEFSLLADFYATRFQAKQQFYKTDFLDITIFSNAIFEKPAQWLYNKVSSKTIISFENAIFKDGIDISRANFFCKVTFWGVSIEPLIPNDLRMFQECESQNKYIRKETAYKRIRESYRKIKQVFISENNIIDSLTFKSKEMEIYWGEIGVRWDLFKWKIFQKNIIPWTWNYTFLILVPAGAIRIRSRSR
jgi:hypothetical protein